MDRIDELETKITYQELAIAELSAELYGQSGRLAAAERLLRSVADKLKELASEGPALPPNERPPHY